MPVSRLPAPSAFLARRIAAIRWVEGKPGPRSRLMLVECCRAELEWALAEWRALAGDSGEPAAGSPGPHPSEALRLPHEQAAAAVINAHLHVDVENWRIRDLKRVLRQQRRAALDGRQSSDYRLAWANARAGSLRDWRVHRVRRQVAWRCFLAAASRYRAMRAGIDAADLLAA